MLKSGWSFRSYISDGGEDAVRAWFDGLPLNVQAYMSSCLGICRAQPLKYWEEKRLYKPLQEELSALGELIFKVPEPKVNRGEKPRTDHYRMLGVSDESRCEFTLLHGFKKTRGQTDYDEFGKLALNRLKEVKLNRRFSTQSDWLFPYEL